MTPSSLIILFAIMLVLAAIPSASVGLVVARSATAGISNGIATSFGIVLGDLVFVLLALLGMTALAEAMGSFFVVIRYFAGAYLIWMGIALLRSVPGSGLRIPRKSRKGMVASFVSGFFLTLGDVKAIFFYASLFPAFIDLSHFTVFGIVSIASITIITVGGVKTVYAISARRIVERIHNAKIQRAGRATAGGLMVGAGAYIIAKG